MSAEKKKRIPKPLKTDGISLLIETVPWLGSDVLTDDDVFNYATALCGRGSENPGKFEVSKKEFPAMFGESIRRSLCMTARIIRKSYRLPCSEPEKKEAEDWLLEITERADAKVYRLTQAGIVVGEERWHVWSRPSECVAYWLATALIEAFRFDGAGKKYIGACPRCKKIFEKKRGDQEFCGKYCATESSRRKK